MTRGVPAEPLRPGAWSRARKVLAIRLDNLGDLLMTTPALAAAKASRPDARLTLLTSAAGVAAAPHLPFVDEVWRFDAPWVGGRADDGPPGDAESALVARLAAGGFDAAVIFTVCTQSALPAALLCRMAGIPLRLAHCRENPYGLLTDWRPETDAVGDAMRHEVRRQLDLVGSVGWGVADERLRFALRDADRAAARARLAAAGIAPGRRYAVVHPGASAPSRRWPPERFAAVADALADAGLSVVVAGDGDDVPLRDAVVAAMRERAAVAAGTTLGELGALLAGAALLVANNSGPAHLAAAVGTPVVVLYALTNPQHTPWQVRAKVLARAVACRWCLKSRCPQGHHECLAGVTADDAIAAALALARPNEQTMEQDA